MWASVSYCRVACSNHYTVDGVEVTCSTSFSAVVLHASFTLCWCTSRIAQAI